MHQLLTKPEYFLYSYRFSIKDTRAGIRLEQMLLLSTMGDVLSNDIMQTYAGLDTSSFQMQQLLLICVSMNLLSLDTALNIAQG